MIEKFYYYKKIDCLAFYRFNLENFYYVEIDITPRYCEVWYNLRVSKTPNNTNTFIITNKKEWYRIVRKINTFICSKELPIYFHYN